MNGRGASYLPSMALFACLVLLAGAPRAQEAADRDPAAGEPPAVEAPAEDPPAEPRVRRLGDVEAEDYDLGITLPRTPARSGPGATIYDLPDPDQNARLQGLLARLAARPGDAPTLRALEALLNDVLDEAYALMDQSRLIEADQRLAVVRNVNPRQEGLEQATRDLQALLESEAERPAPPTARPPAGKTNTVDSVSPYRLPIAAQTRRLDELMSALARTPGNRAAALELESLLNDVLAQAEVAVDERDFERAERLLGVVRSVNPRKRGLAEGLRDLEQAREIAELLDAAERAARRGALYEPLTDSAYFYYRKVLALDSVNREAIAGLASVQQVMVGNAIDAARNLDFELAEAWLREASAVREPQDLVEDARQEIQSFRDLEARRIEDDVAEALRRGDYEYAEFRLIDLIALGGYEERVAALREGVAREQIYGQFEPGQRIQDRFLALDGSGPAVVVIGPGSFAMGATAADRDAEDDERPAHRVTLERGFALGLTEITVAEFGLFVQEAGYRTEAERDGRSPVWDEQLGRLADRDGVHWRHDYAGQPADGALPVLHVSWNDASAYVRWLSEATGQTYRLPTEAEFEYALRGGTRTIYWWGDSRPSEPLENLSGSEDQSPTGRHFSNALRSYGDGYWGPAPVGSFQPNPWGLFDLAGNVSEWVQDCWHGNYTRAPLDGSAWENAGCARRVVRGAYWASAPEQARSSARISAPHGLHAPQVGFRVVREL
ncbi:MAG: formylglycine-generating enzyme family protein [Gammaproteobacteria bacterium]